MAIFSNSAKILVSLYILMNRPRQIVELASTLVRNNYSREWFRRDEFGGWEKRAEALLEETAEKAASLGMTEAAVNREIASHLALISIEAQIRNPAKIKRSRSHSRA